MIKTFFLNNRVYFVWLIFVLQIIALLTSWYLFQLYTINPALGKISIAPCNINSVFSCETVNVSAYAKIFGVPLSWLGILWTLGLMVVVTRVLRIKKDIFDIWLYSLTGVVFLPYLWYAEWVLRAVCIQCTIIHITVLMTFLLSWILLDENIKKRFTITILGNFSVKVLAVVGVLAVISGMVFSVIS